MENILQRELNSYILKLFILLFMVISPSIYASEMDLQQIIKEKKVTINVKGKTLDEILLMITKQTTIGYGYSGVEPNNSEKYNLNVTDETVEKALNTLLSGTKYNYFITNNKIVISKRALITKENEKITVKGRIVDENNKPIVGATVLVEGTSNGSISSGDGAFSINTTKGANLEVSYTGCKTMKETVNESNANLVIKLYPDIMAVDEVIVTGYQTVNKRDAVMSQTTIKADDIKVAGVSNITEMLQGQVAGMMVTNTSSRVGTTSSIKIRGTATLGNSDPIFVVDGIIQPDALQFNVSVGINDDIKNIIGNQVSWLSPDDIDTITVLKDASATAIYGSRASNGVIVITTKKPKNGDRMSINYTGSMTIAPRPTYDRFNYMNSQERIIFSEEAFAAGARYQKEPIRDDNTYEGIYAKFLIGSLTQDQFLQRKGELEMLNTDWFDLLTRTAITHNHNISISGASEKSTYRASVGYSKNNGIEKGNSSERITANTNIGFQLHKKVKLDFLMNATLGSTTGYGPGVSPISYATRTSRAIPAYEKDGSHATYKVKNTYQWNDQSEYLAYSILNEMESTESKVSSANINVSMNFGWDITKWLKYEFTAGGSFVQGDRYTYAMEESFYVAKTYRGYDFGTVDATNPWYNAAKLPRGGEKFTSKSNTQAYNMQNKLIFRKQINDNNRINVMLAMEVRSTTNKDDQHNLFGFSKDKGNLMIRPTAPDKFVPIGGSPMTGLGLLDELYNRGGRFTELENNFVSMFMTAAYTFKDRYVFNANVRNDRSNRFGQAANSKFDPTFSFGASWRLSSEPWMESVNKIFSNVNFKATYGIQGNANLAVAPDLILTQQGIISPFEDFGASIKSIPNPDLSWERTHNWNFGLEFGLFSKFNFVVDYYTRSSDAVINQSIPLCNGLEKMSVNGGKIYNNGIEATVSFNPVVTRDFGINVSINSSKNWNKGGKVLLPVNSTNYLDTKGRDYILREGYPLSAFWSYEFMGLRGDNGAPIFNNMDVNKDEAKEDPTRVLVYTGPSEPDFTGGLNFSIRYKNLSLSSSFSLLLGGYKRLTNPYSDFIPGANLYLPDAISNVNKDLNNRWKKPGDELRTNIPAIVQGNVMIVDPLGSTTAYTKIYGQSSALIASSSFFRCQNLGINYRVNSETIKKIGLNSLKIGASVSNLFVIASKKYNGFDPELRDSVKPQGYSLSLSFGF